MTPLNQHIALLTSMGWTVTTPSCGVPPVETVHSRIHGYDYLPELTLDLMASAEASLTDDQAFRYYSDVLPHIVFIPYAKADPIGSRPLISATKEQRREAYLRTRGLWV